MAIPPICIPLTLRLMASVEHNTSPQHRAAPTVAEVVAVADSLWPFATQESWDASELVIGRPQAQVRRILVAVDPVSSVVTEAVREHADLLLVHHPLMLGGQSSVAADTYKGRLVHEMIENRVALLACHTNADSAHDGVSDALIRACGVSTAQPLQPLDGNPDVGLGRIGPLDQPVALRELSERLAAQIPPTAQGLRVAGPAERMIHTVAVCGGAGGSLIQDVAATDADVYVTADLRHHLVSEAREAAMHNDPDGGLCFIDVSHAASEWLWTPVAARALEAALEKAGYGVEVSVSTHRTDPWDFQIPSPHDQPQDRWT